jgi:hypothetical protein
MKNWEFIGAEFRFLRWVFDVRGNKSGNAARFRIDSRVGY